MEAQNLLRDALSEKLGTARARNPSFSMRSLARLLGISSGALTEIFAGRRQVSPRLAQLICTRLGLDPAKQAKILDAFPARARRGKARRDEVDPTYLELSADQFFVLSDLIHYGILSLTQTRDFVPNAPWIARRLGRRVDDVRRALKRLERLALIECDDGRIQRLVPRVRTTDDVASAAIRQSHAQGLELARAAIHEVPLEARDLGSMTMAIDPAQLPAAKLIIRRCREDLAKLLESGDRREVYHFATQLFPLSLVPAGPSTAENSKEKKS